MAKLIACSITGTIRLEVKPDQNAPKFAQDTPIVYEGEYTAENMMDAVEFFENELEKEEGLTSEAEETNSGNDEEQS